MELWRLNPNRYQWKRCFIVSLVQKPSKKEVFHAGCHYLNPIFLVNEWVSSEVLIFREQIRWYMFSTCFPLSLSQHFLCFLHLSPQMTSINLLIFNNSESLTKEQKWSVQRWFWMCIHLLITLFSDVQDKLWKGKHWHCGGDWDKGRSADTGIPWDGEHVAGTRG